MSTDNQESGNGLGVYLRRLGLLVFLVVVLVATRGAIAGMYEYSSSVNWLAGILVVVFVSCLPLWFLLRYEDSYYEE